MTRPLNVLVLMSDEHNPKFMGCAGHSFIQTPNLDRLTSRGIDAKSHEKFGFTLFAGQASIPVLPRHYLSRSRNFGLEKLVAAI